MITTRDRLIDAAADLFSRNGFHSVGLDRILDEVGVTKTTFYNHFESKDDLVVALLEHRDRIETEALLTEARARAGDDPAARMLAVFDVLLDWFRDSDYRGCIFISAAVAYPAVSDPIHRAAAAHGASVFSALRTLARAAGADDSDRIAAETLLLIAGAMTLWQISGDAGAARTARAAMEALLHRRTAPHAASGA